GAGSRSVRRARSWWALRRAALGRSTRRCGFGISPSRRNAISRRARGAHRRGERRTMRRVELSVVIPVGKRVDDIESLHHDYRRGLDRCGLTYEMIYVLDGDRDEGRRLAELRADGEPIEIVKLGKSFGEATALMVGFANADG